MTINVFPQCSSELKSALETFIEKVFNKEQTPKLYVVDESSEEGEIKKFWDQIDDLDSISPILFITYSGAELQGCLEFLKPLINKWDTWNPTKGVFLRPVLEYLLGVQDQTNGW